MSPTRGVRTTFARGADSDTFRTTGRLVIRERTPPNDLSRSASNLSLETSTAMTTSAPRSRASSTGRFSTSPPSTRRRAPYGTGEKTPGIDMLARIASARLPPERTTFSPDTMSVATQRNGMGRSSNFSIPTVPSVSDFRRNPSFCPAMSPEGKAIPRGVSPISRST